MRNRCSKRKHIDNTSILIGAIFSKGTMKEMYFSSMNVLIFITALTLALLYVKIYSPESHGLYKSLDGMSSELLDDNNFLCLTIFYKIQTSARFLPKANYPTKLIARFHYT